MTNRKHHPNAQKHRLTFAVLRFLKDLSPREATLGTERSSPERRPIATSTVRNLRRPVKDGGTLYPRATTLSRLCEAHGASIEVIVEGKVFRG